ncbi:MAG: hypothetical protein ABJP02_05040 [Parasphingorhabdus sp.]|uniref:hypothetical protein n=1 Tax=Parasphingorhabdus sp. TaxID=2709688 RepID=UPI003298D783
MEKEASTETDISDKATSQGEWDVSKIPILVEKSWKEICPKTYPTDYTLQDACRRNMIEGSETLEAAIADHPDDQVLKAAMIDCLEQHSNGGTDLIDFSFAGSCIRSHLEARSNMKSKN